MKKFVFSLASLLHIKETLEEKQKSELRSIEERLYLKISELNILNDDIYKLQSDFKNKLQNEVTVMDFKRYDSYCGLLKSKIRVKNKEIKVVEKEKEESKEKLLCIMKERKALEKLREKKYSEYLLEIKKQQEKEIEDFVSYHFTVYDKVGGQAI